MTFSKFIDNYSLSVASKVMKNTKYFSKGVDSKTISEWLEIISIDLPKLNGEGYYPVQVQYEGKTEEAAFKVDQWLGNDYPTIIYHHGAAEGAYDVGFNSILGKHKKNIKANLIAMQALFNHNNKEFMESIAYLSNYALMLAASTLFVEKLVQEIKKTCSGKVVMTGTSLGGAVTNLHFTYYRTADLYKPMLASARLAEVFIDSAYSKVTSDYGKAHPEKLRKVLNIDKDFAKKNQSNLFSLLAEHDQIFPFDTHSVDYDISHLKVIPYGHANGAMKHKILRQHVLDGLNA